MKKHVFTAILALSLTMSSSLVFAATENSISSDKTTVANTVFTGADAPRLIISPTKSTAGEDTLFKLVLTNAKWNYNTTGKITEGVEYTLLGDDTMMVQVDATYFDMSSKDLIIPLEVEVLEEDNAYVTVDPMNSTVSAGTYIFAHTVYPQTEINVTDVNEENMTFTVKAEDNYGYLFNARRCFTLELPKGFEFVSCKNPYGTGKYKGIFEFSIDKSNPRIAYFTTTANAAGGEGEMIAEDIKIKALDTAAAGDVNLSIKAAYGISDTLKFDLFTYEKEDRSSTETEKPEATEKQVIKFTCGIDRYYIDSMPYKVDAPAVVDENSRVILPMRYLANALGIADENIEYITENGRSYARFTDGERVVEIGVNEKFITIDGVKTEIDTAAVIRNDRMYLPLRAAANALGIDDSNISWDDSTKTVTIERAKA